MQEANGMRRPIVMQAECVRKDVPHWDAGHDDAVVLWI